MDQWHPALIFNVLMIFALISAFHELKSRTGTVGFFACKINAMLVERNTSAQLRRRYSVLGLVLGVCSSL